MVCLLVVAGTTGLAKSCIGAASCAQFLTVATVLNGMLALGRQTITARTLPYFDRNLAMLKTWIGSRRYGSKH